MIKFIKKCLIFLSIILILAAIIFSIVRALTPWAIQYKPNVEQQLSALIGQPVTIESMETGWYWFQPVIKLKQIEINNNEHIKLNKLFVGINLLSSLWHWRFQPGILYLDGIDLNLEQQENNSWQVKGLPISSNAMMEDKYFALLSWILAQHKIIIRNVSSQLHLKDGRYLPVHDVDFTVAHGLSGLRIKGNASIANAEHTHFQVLATLNLNAYALYQTSGHVFFLIEKASFKELQSLFPVSPITFLDGHGDIELWTDIHNGAITNAQARLNLKQLHWQNSSTQKNQIIPLVRANLVWHPIKNGWELGGDHIDLTLRDKEWPQNNVWVRYQQDKKYYSLYVKHILIDSLLSMNFTWPQTLSSWLAAKPQGQLYDTQLRVKENNLNYVLTRFSNLGWMAHQNIPSMDNLSGVLYWQPNEGRLALESTDLHLTSPNYSPLNIPLLNADLSWKKSPTSGFKLTIERIVLKHPHLILSSSGVVNKLGDPHSGADAQIKARFLSENTQYWLNYIPSTYLKPKLDHWLKHEIKRIAKAEGDVVFEGAVADFPFDKQSGIFTIKSHLSGVDLRFAPHWPITKDIEAYLTIDKRALHADIVHAMLKDVELEKANLRIMELGLDREVLFIHSQVETDSDKALPYVLSSPLQKKLSPLRLFTLQGLINLDLQLEIALYPGNDSVLVLGDVAFKDNKGSLHYSLGDLTFDHFDGNLKLNQDGIVNSDLTTTVLNHPVNISMKSIHQPKSYTQIKINSHITTNMLREMLKLPIVSVMHGSFDLKSTFQLSSEANSHFHLQSLLKGLRIDLPAPLGKVANTTTPLTIDIDLTPSNTLRIDLNYNDFKATIASLDKDWSIQLNQETIAGDLRYLTETHTLTGTLDKLVIKKSTLEKQNVSSESHFKPSDIPQLNLDIKSLHWDDLDLGAMHLKTTSGEHQWTIDEGKITTPAYQITAHGNWVQDGQNNSTQLEIQMNISDLAKSLERWKISPVMSSHRGNIEFNGGWKGSIIDFSLADVEGKMSMKIKDGLITQLSSDTVDKLAFGKLLSILSLQTIPRRLKLDFSDLFNSGYSFDELKGNFTIAHGIMTTEDSTIDGPVAYASIKGNLDIVRQLYDLNLRISPHITSSLPLMVTLAGGPVAGPVAGIATWAASKIINQGVQKITGYMYKVSGPWKQPVIKQENIVEKK